MTLSPAPDRSVTSVTLAHAEHTQESALVWSLHEKLGSWQAVADVFGFSRMFWWKVAHGEARLELSSRTEASLKAKAQTLRDVKQRLGSSDPKFLRLIQQGVVPWLAEREVSP